MNQFSDVLNITLYQAKYFAYELTKRGASNSIEKIAGTLADAKVDLNPHQVDAALFAFKSPLSTGAILADEVGLGKTIEAGIVLSQMWAEGKRKILLIMPASLRKQWNQELADKFYLPSTILEAASFNKEMKAGMGNPFDRKGKEIVICSYQFAARKEEQLISVPWDLVVIDEAHRLRNVYKKSNVNGRKLRTALHGRPKVLLTATPLQNSLMELYGLVSFIDEYAFGDAKSFRSQYTRSDNEATYNELRERLKPLCQRTLRRQVSEYINYTQRIPMTEEFIPGDDEMELYNLVSTYLQRDEIKALPSSQRKLMTLVLRKLLASSSYAIAGALNSLANKLQKQLSEDDDARKKAEEEYEEDLQKDYERLPEIEDELDESSEEEEAFLTAEDRITISQEIDELREFQSRAVSITENAKGEALIKALERGFAAMRNRSAPAPEKAIIFTESRRTQNYLVERLSIAEYGDDLVLFNGSNNDQLSKDIYNAAKDGQTIAVGGLIREQIIDNRSQIPLLGDIPLLGLAFRGSNKGRLREEIIILMTPHIISTPGEGAAISRRVIESQNSLHPLLPEGKGSLELFKERHVIKPSTDELDWGAYWKPRLRGDYNYETGDIQIREAQPVSEP